MPRRSCEFHAGLAYHLYNRGAEKARVFLRREHYELFLGSFGSARPPGVAVLALCLLPNHWHMGIFVRQDPDSVSQWLQRALTRFGRRYRSRWGGVGPLWQGRAGSRTIQCEVDLSGVARYIERNPVEAKTAHRPEDWLWSSANASLRERYPWIAERPFDSP